MKEESTSLINILGFLAGLLTTSAFLPQLIKTWNTKSAKDVSSTMFTIFILGVGLWLVYGYEIHSYPVMIANTITLVLAILILSLKIAYEHIDA